MANLRNLPNPESKIGRVLAALLGGQSYNLIEAQRELHDRSLHTTISDLQTRYGIIVDRNTEKIPGYLGKLFKCRRYWLSPEERARIVVLQKEKSTTTKLKNQD